MNFQKKTLFAFAVLWSSLFAQDISPFITVDQFGYRPSATKTAVIRDPQLGSDSARSFTPGSVYQVIDSVSGTSVYEGAPVAYASGAVDAASGDKIWWFDFSSVTTAGTYYVLDVSKNVKSYTFKIATDVYNDVLKQAVRMFFYQRAGFAKEATYAGAGWADGASHLGAGQDSQAHLFSAKTDESTVRDLQGGWYDAGDFNKYTAWASGYIEEMLLAYRELPQAFTDDYNIPESGNGIPDILDEAMWGIAWLKRMQNADGSVLSLVGLASASPPSAATGKSYYGPANTIATITAAKAFALGAIVFYERGEKTYASELYTAATKAWTWANAHPDSLFHNNSSTNGSSGLGAGDQEDETDYTRLGHFMNAALYLYAYTGQADYLSVFESQYEDLPLFAWTNYMDQYRIAQNIMLYRYVKMQNVSSTVQGEVSAALELAINKSADFAGKIGADGYRSFIKDYNWGSNSYKSNYGLILNEAGKTDAAEDYLHYIHGVNPFSMVYLTNMNAFGAGNSVTQIYHTWFADGSAKWDAYGVSTSGPAPGYLAGGPNSSYTWDACCDNQSCGGTENNAKCTAETVPIGEPDAKMYKDFNTNWPLNSWSLTEPSLGYQVAYVHLLSKFVEPKGTIQGIKSKNQPSTLKGINVRVEGNTLHIYNSVGSVEKVHVYDVQQRLVASKNGADAEMEISVAKLPAGVYFVRVQTGSGIAVQRIIR